MTENSKDIIYRVKKTMISCLELDLQAEDIENEDMLFGSHLGLDSVGTLILIEALEEEFQIVVEDEELSAELFESAKSLEKFIKRKMNDGSK